MSDNPKQAEREMEKAIFISADCWLEVFDLLPPAQLGLGIAMISRRFDFYVDEHFKTRKWKLRPIVIRHKIGANGAKEMEIVNSDEKALPIPQNPLPKKVIGFRSIKIIFIDQNVLTFLRHFHRFFSVCATSLTIGTENVRISEFLLLTIWPMLKHTIRDMILNPITLRQIRQLVPSMLNDCPALRIVGLAGVGILPEFPPDESANASDCQAVAKWMFSPRPDNLMKVLYVRIENSAVDQWLSMVERIKAAFSAASSPVYFAISVHFPPSSSLSFAVPFKLTNEFSGETLALLQEDANCLVFIRCPILPDERQQTIKELGERWNRIDILIGDDGVGDGLLDGSPGPSDG